MPMGQGVQEMHMRMGQAQGVDAFVSNMQHAQVKCRRPGVEIWASIGI